jgi:membrane protease YdiL (CAAX protease family)
VIATSSSTTTRQTVTSTADDLPQYQPRQIIGIWLAATVPMSLLGWVIAPWVSHHIHSRDPFIDSLVVAFDIGLIWMIALALIIVRREQGSLHWPAVRRGLRLNAPRDPRTGLGWRRVWIYAVLFTVSTGLVNMLPLDPQGPLPRDLPSALLTTRVQDYFHHNWVGYGLMVINMFASPIAEELIFRGVLLPRTRAVFGRGNVVANGALFTFYHLHQPWSMPITFIDGVINQAWPSDRYRSTWMGLITHTAPSFLVGAILLNAVLS